MNWDWRKVPVPDRMKHLGRDKRGFPIPANVAHAADGSPVFTVNDEATVWEHIANNQCGICGTEIEPGQFHFVGGPASGLVSHRYFDGPMHGECARYALQVCPYIAAPKYTKRLDDLQLAQKAADAGVKHNVFEDRTMIAGRPVCFVLIRAESFSITWPRTHDRKFIPVGSIFAPEDSQGRFMLEAEVWNEGKLVEGEEAGRLVERGIRDAMAVVQESGIQSKGLVMVDEDGKVQRVAGLDEE